MQPGLRDFVRGSGEGLPCACLPQACHCHLSGVSCSSTAGSWPWAGKEQPSEVGRLNCSLTPVPHGSFVCVPRPPVPSESTACELSCCAPRLLALRRQSLPCALPVNCSTELSKPPLPKIISASEAGKCDSSFSYAERCGGCLKAAEAEGMARERQL